jgi:hypothetical protein
MSRLQTHLTTLQELQTSEANLYQVLTDNAQRVASGIQPQLTEQEINSILKQVQTLSSSRTSLYNDLNHLYQEQAGYSKEANQALAQQTMSLQLFEKDLNKSKQALSKLQDDTYNQLKMVEINTYYSKKSQTQTSFMKWTVIIGVIVLLSILSKRVVGDTVGGILSSIAMVIGGVILSQKLYDMYSRRSDIYDEYNWMNTPNANNTSYMGADPIFDISGSLIPYFCYENSCCSTGTTYVDGSGCVANSDLGTTDMPSS